MPQDAADPKAPQPKLMKAPKGTRDLYPADMLRRRYLTETWRAVSIRHGFEEIDGPTFEAAELYAVKSGEGILGELFQAFSGKDPAEVEQVMREGRAPYALRPEFTPTLARMYAARAKQLPKPTRWFCIPQFFRAERPQRGRLREFLQWNVDVIGGEVATAAKSEAETVALLGECAVEMGFAHSAQLHVNGAELTLETLKRTGFPEDRFREATAHIDLIRKMDREKWLVEAARLGFSDSLISLIAGGYKISTKDVEQSMGFMGAFAEGSSFRLSLEEFANTLQAMQFKVPATHDLSIVRGLAYYTGTVFELLADGERAIAGGGRYDNLIELFGGPPTPAVGFAMGDVVLSLLLEDNKLMPGADESDPNSTAELMDAVQRASQSYSLRPDAFVVPNGDDENESLVTPLVAHLRRGVESETYQQREDRKPWHADRYAASSHGVAPLHARVTSKSTRNLKKLLADATSQSARFAVVVHGPDRVQLKDLDTREDLTPNDIGIASQAEFSVNPTDPHYVGRAIATRSGR